MTDLLIRIYLDEDVNVLIAQLLRARGFDVTTTREVGQLGKSDSEQLTYAVNQGRTLLTHNRVDFEALAQAYLAAGQMHYGIIFAARNCAKTTGNFEPLNSR